MLRRPQDPPRDPKIVTRSRSIALGCLSVPRYRNISSGRLRLHDARIRTNNERIIQTATKERNLSREAAGDSPQASSIRPLPLERAVWNVAFIALLFIQRMLHSISSKSIVLPYGKYRGMAHASAVGPAIQVCSRSLLRVQKSIKNQSKI